MPIHNKKHDSLVKVKLEEGFNIINDENKCNGSSSRSKGGQSPCPSSSRSRGGQSPCPSSSRSRGAPRPCPICGVVISNSYNLSCHLRRHNNDRPFKCDQCEAAFIHKAELKKHKIKHSDNRPFECKLCQKSFKEIKSLNSHMDSHGVNIYKCKVCGLTFKSQVNCKKHELHSHNTNKLKCKYCYKTFLEMKFKEDHENIHKKDKKAIDLRRKENWTSRNMQKRKLEKKASMVNGEFCFYPCNICSERFKYRKDQLSHYETKHKEEYDKNFKVCNLCGKLLTAKHFKSHLEAHKGILPFHCTICEYKTNRKTDLKIHELTHTTSYYPYSCSQCKRFFKQKSHAVLCEKRHSGKKDIKCPLCEMTFFTTSEFNRHNAKSHNTNICKLCGFKPSSIEMLSEHKLKEHGIAKKKNSKRSYMCDKCGNFYPSLSSLSNHTSKQHSLHPLNITKPKLCYYCDYSYKSNGELINHCLEAHPNKVKKCEICNYETISINYFINHVKSHVKKSPEELLVFAGINTFLKKKKNSLYECHFCGFCTNEKEVINNHVKAHENKIQEFSRTMRSGNFDNPIKIKNFKRESPVNIKIKCVPVPHPVNIKEIDKIEYTVAKISSNKFELLESKTVVKEERNFGSFEQKCENVFSKPKNIRKETTKSLLNNSIDKPKTSVHSEKVTIKIKKINASNISRQTHSFSILGKSGTQQFSLIGSKHLRSSLLPSPNIPSQFSVNEESIKKFCQKTPDVITIM